MSLLSISNTGRYIAGWYFLGGSLCSLGFFVGMYELGVWSSKRVITRTINDLQKYQEVSDNNRTIIIDGEVVEIQEYIKKLENQSELIK